MKLAKKLLALALAGVLALTVLTGCSGSADLLKAFKREIGAASVTAYPGLTTQKLDNAIKAATKYTADTVKWETYKDDENAENRYKWAQQDAFWIKFNEETDDLLRKKSIKGELSGGIAFYTTIISVYKPAGASNVAKQLTNNLGEENLVFDTTGNIIGASWKIGDASIVKPEALKDKNIYLAWSTELLPEYLFNRSGYRLVILGGPELTREWLDAQDPLLPSNP